MLSLFWLFSTTFAILLVLGHPVYGVRRYEKTSCEFVTPNYTLEWAFEPLSRSVVFVLRAEFQDVGDSLWTGVGFGDRNNESIIDFIGVFVKDNGAQTGITDTHINSTTGQFTPDVNTNVQTISIAVSNAAGSTGTQVTAKFARAINSKDTQEDLDLDGCTIFNVPLQPMASVDHSEQQGNYLKSLKQLKVCDIQKYCTVDIRELKLKGETKVIKKPSQPNSTPKPFTEHSKEAHESSAISKPHLQASPSVEVAHSVDISGKGDPCSFTGPTYSVNWSYNKGSDCVDFVMKHSVKKGKWWSTVGIGDNMSDMDIGVMFLEDGKVKKMIDYYSNSYGPPEEDKDQNWVLHSAKSKLTSSKSGDQVELHFSRVINSPDTEKDKSMDGCVLFQFGASIGKYGLTGTKYAIRKHEEWPDLYKACDLKKRCSQNKHHQSKRGGDSLVVGQSVDDPSTNNSTALLQLPIGNSTEQEKSQESVESDGIIALLTQEITTTTATDSTTGQETTQEQEQPTADVVGPTLTTLLPNSTVDDADLLLSSSSTNASSTLQPLDTLNNNPQISDSSPSHPLPLNKP